MTGSNGRDVGATNVGGRADRTPTPDEERDADESPLDPDVARHEKEMNELGANVRGEGEI
ncbi:MAG: hypothetical protein ACYDD4_07500 [Acidimicrobiales bacterium]